MKLEGASIQHATEQLTTQLCTNAEDLLQKRLRTSCASSPHARFSDSRTCAPDVVQDELHHLLLEVLGQAMLVQESVGHIVWVFILVQRQLELVARVHLDIDDQVPLLAIIPLQPQTRARDQTGNVIS